jgi:hypothetical protein
LEQGVYERVSSDGRRLGLEVVYKDANGRTLYFRFLAETGCRMSEGLGLTPRRVGTADVTFAEQLSRRGELVPLKTSQSRRTIEITRSHDRQR